MLKMAVFASVFFWGHRAEFGGGNDRFFGWESLHLTQSRHGDCPKAAVQRMR
jgi:hypothetical protein